MTLIQWVLSDKRNNIEVLIVIASLIALGVLLGYSIRGDSFPVTLSEGLMLGTAVATCMAGCMAANTAKNSLSLSAKQHEHIENEALKNDLYRCITLCEKEIMEVSETDINLDIINHPTLRLRDILFSPVYIPYVKLIFKAYKHDNEIDISSQELSHRKIIFALYLALQRMGQYLIVYDDISNNNSTAKYYRDKYRIAAQGLEDAEFEMHAFWNVLRKK